MDRTYKNFIPVEGVCRTINLKIGYDGTITPNEIDLGYQGDSCVTTINVNAEDLLWSNVTNYNDKEIDYNEEYTMFLIVKGIGAFIMDEGYLEVPKQITNVVGTHEMVVTIQRKIRGTFERLFTSNTIRGKVEKSSYDLFKDVEGDGSILPVYDVCMLRQELSKTQKVVEWNRDGVISIKVNRNDTEDDTYRLGYYGDEDVSSIKLIGLSKSSEAWFREHYHIIMALKHMDQIYYTQASVSGMSDYAEFGILEEVFRTPGKWQLGFLIKTNEPLDDTIKVNEPDNPLYNYHAYSNILELNVDENILTKMNESDWRDPTSYINVYDRNNVLLQVVTEDDKDE